MGNNMTTGTEWKRILLFSLPIMLGQLLQQLYSTIDGIIVGNFVSQSALAAIGTCTTLTMIFLAASWGLSNGAGIMIAQFFGAKRHDDLREAASTAFLLLGVMGIVFSFIGSFFARPLIAGFLNVAEGEIRNLAIAYFSVYAVGLFFQCSYNAIAYILRAIGDSKATLYFLCISSVINLILDLLFVIGFHWGIQGAAVATVIAQFCSLIASYLYINKKYKVLRFRLRELRFSREKCRLCLRLGIPTTMQQCVISFGDVFVQRLINSFGPYTMAACTVGLRIQSYTMVPILGLNMGMANFTGQNIGAGKLDRVKRGLRAALTMELAFTAVVVTATYLFAPNLAALFGVSGEALKQAVENIQFQSMFFLIGSAYFAFSAVIQGSGDVGFATVCTMGNLVCRVAFAYIFAYVFSSGYQSCWYSMPIGWSVALCLALLRYRSGSWTHKSVVKQAQN